MSAISQIRDILYGHSKMAIGVTATLGIAALVFGILGQCEIGIFKGIGTTNAQIMMGVSAVPLLLTCYMSYQRYSRTSLDGFVNYYQNRFDSSDHKAWALSDGAGSEVPRLYEYIRDNLNHIDLDEITEFSDESTVGNRYFLYKRELLDALFNDGTSVTVYHADYEKTPFMFMFPKDGRTAIQLKHVPQTKKHVPQTN